MGLGLTQPLTEMSKK